MGKGVKVVLVMSIIVSLLIFSALGYYVNNGINSKINSLQSQLQLMDKKRQYYAEAVVNLQSIKTNLQNQIALEGNKTEQEQLQSQLKALNDAQAQALAAEQAQQQAQQQALAQQQQQQMLAQQQAQRTATRVVAPVRTRAS